jgi:aspartyl-tRNA synthetase
MCALSQATTTKDSSFLSGATSRESAKNTQAFKKETFKNRLRRYGYDSPELKHTRKFMDFLDLNIEKKLSCLQRSAVLFLQYICAPSKKC